MSSSKIIVSANSSYWPGSWRCNGLRLLRHYPFHSWWHLASKFEYCSLNIEHILGYIYYRFLLVTSSLVLCEWFLPSFVCSCCVRVIDHDIVLWVWEYKCSRLPTYCNILLTLIALPWVKDVLTQYSLQPFNALMLRLDRRLGNGWRWCLTSVVYLLERAHRY